MEKNFLPEWSPPVLVWGVGRTYIEFLARNRAGIRRRYRLTFNLNRIHNLSIRRQRGQDICRQLHWWLSSGFPIDDFKVDTVQLKVVVDADAQRKNMGLIEAMDLARKIKHNPEREKTNASFSSHVRRFIHYLGRANLNHLKIGEVGRVHALGYLDYYRLEKRVRPSTYNNVIAHMHALFEVLRQRSYLDVNPFANIPKLKTTK